MPFNTITSYVCLNPRHGLWRTIVTFAIKTCFKTCLPRVNLLQILFTEVRSSCALWPVDFLMGGRNFISRVYCLATSPM